MRALHLIFTTSVPVVQGLIKFPSPKHVQILTLLCEGMSLHAISRRVDMSAKRVVKLLVDAGRRAPSSTMRRFTV
jgi:hypothetical protein